jgi:hypothetical protein
MSKTMKVDFSNAWVIGIGVGILGCVGGVVYALLATE